MVEIVKKLHRAISDRDAKAMVTLAAFKIEDTARALGLDPKEGLKQGLKEAEAGLTGFPKDAKVSTFDPKLLRFVPMAGGKLVKVTDDKGQAPVAVSTSGQTATFDVVVARIGGVWMLVR